MAHKKKNFDDLSRGKYSREKLADGVREILNCQKTVDKVHKDFGIPVRTIQHHVKYVWVGILLWSLF